MNWIISLISWYQSRGLSMIWNFLFPPVAAVQPFRIGFWGSQYILIDFFQHLVLLKFKILQRAASFATAHIGGENQNSTRFLDPSTHQERINAYAFHIHILTLDFCWLCYARTDDQCGSIKWNGNGAIHPQLMELETTFWRLRGFGIKPKYLDKMTMKLSLAHSVAFINGA